MTGDATTQYAEAVLSGEINAGPHVRNACHRHMHDLENGHLRGLRFDAASADRFFRYCSSCLVLSHGRFHGKPFELHISQKFIAGSIFGWKKYDQNLNTWVRRYRIAYVEAGKGNGKSPLMAAMGFYLLLSDGEKGAQIYFIATNREQAKIAFSFAVQMYEHSKALKKRITPTGKTEIYRLNVSNPQDRGVCKPFSWDEARKSGIMPSGAFFDEIHEFPNDDTIDKIIAGAKNRAQPLFFMATNSGFDRLSKCWEFHQTAIKCAMGSHNIDERGEHFPFRGGVIDDTFFSYVCALDYGEKFVEHRNGEWVNNETCWVKANPLLDVTISREWLRNQVTAATLIPSRYPTVERLNFCIWNNARSVWLSHAVIESILTDFDIADLAGRKTWIALDLAGKNDLAAAFVISEDGEDKYGRPKFLGFTTAWTPGKTLQARSERDQAPYTLWAQQGHLEVCEGDLIDYSAMARWIAEFGFIVELQAIAYDAYAWKRFFAPELEAAGVDVPTFSHPQAGVRKFKNTDGTDNPIELWMPSSLAQFEKLSMEGRLKIKRSPVMIMALSAAVVDSDAAENRWLSKRKATARIDPAVAACMAVGLQHAMSIDLSGCSSYLESGNLVVV